jgi:hypothetical protein
MTLVAFTRHAVGLGPLLLRALWEARDHRAPNVLDPATMSITWVDCRDIWPGQMPVKAGAAEESAKRRRAQSVECKVSWHMETTYVCMYIYIHMYIYYVWPMEAAQTLDQGIAMRGQRIAPNRGL